MSRSAIFASLTLHAGLLLLVGWRWSSNSARIGSGPTGADGALFADAIGGSLVIAPPMSREPVTEPQLAEPEFIQSAPAAVHPAPPISTIAVVPMQQPMTTGIPHEISVVKPKVSSFKNGRASQRAFARSGPDDGQGGSGLKGEGGGLHGAGYVPPQFRLRYKPLYPEAARAQRLEGTVLLLVSVDVAGRVTNMNVLHSCGHPVLDRAALAAVRAWRFDPARQNGVAIFARVEVPVRFRFEERSAARS